LCAQRAHIKGTVDKDCSVALALAAGDGDAGPTHELCEPGVVVQDRKPRTASERAISPSSIARSDLFLTQPQWSYHGTTGGP
jgi:hypothetical protein